uniref:Histidinol dehydrogenaseic isoform X3 n=1 Tax=Rhizophora mucronata TaxID=61149 RepID=A0A2P2LMJ5_RHIMU
MVKLWLSAFKAYSPLGRLAHCLVISSSIAFRSTPSPAITRTT